VAYLGGVLIALGVLLLLGYFVRREKSIVLRDFGAAIFLIGMIVVMVRLTIQ